MDRRSGRLDGRGSPADVVAGGSANGVQAARCPSRFASQRCRGREVTEPALADRPDHSSTSMAAVNRLCSAFIEKITKKTTKKKRKSAEKSSAQRTSGRCILEDGGRWEARFEWRLIQIDGSRCTQKMQT